MGMDSPSCGIPKRTATTQFYKKNVGLLVIDCASGNAPSLRYHNSLEQNAVEAQISSPSSSSYNSFYVAVGHTCVRPLGLLGT